MFCRKLFLSNDLKFVSKRIDCNFSKKIKVEKTPNKIKRNVSHKDKLTTYLNSYPYLRELKQYIPSKYLQNKRQRVCDNLYLINQKVAEDMAKHILPILKTSKQIVCETTPGFGLLTSELLDGGIDFIRLYEPCPEYRHMLQEFEKTYPGRVELFGKDLYHISRLSYFDKQDKGDRADQLLKGIPKVDWKDEPAMTIIGPMPKLLFLKYLFRMIALQSEIITYGRIQIIAVIFPGEYLRLTAGPHLDLHTYIIPSVLFNIYFEIELLARYPRKAFLPWQSSLVIHSQTKPLRKYDINHMYLVRINMKKNLPLPPDKLLPFYVFVHQLFGRGTYRVIPTIEKWIPEIGSYILANYDQYSNHFEDLDIYTKGGEMNPKQILTLFKIISSHPAYENSPFIAMVEAELMKTETIETHLDEEPSNVKGDLLAFEDEAKGTRVDPLRNEEVTHGHVLEDKHESANL